MMSVLVRYIGMSVNNGHGIVPDKADGRLVRQTCRAAIHARVPTGGGRSAGRFAEPAPGRRLRSNPSGAYVL